MISLAVLIFTALVLLSQIEDEAEAFVIQRRTIKMPSKTSRRYQPKDDSNILAGIEFHITTVLDPTVREEHLKRKFLAEELNTKKFTSLMDTHKALLFRPEREEEISLKQFSHFVSRHLKFQKYPYPSAVPRKVIQTKSYPDVAIDFRNQVVQIDSESAPNVTVPFNHEYSLSSPIRPQYIFLFCDKAADFGGETSFVDSTKVYRYVKEAF